MIPQDKQKATSASRHRHWNFTAVAVVLLLLGILTRGHAIAEKWQAAVDPQLLAMSQNGGEIDFIVALPERADLSRAKEFNSKAARGQFVYETLSETAVASQSDLLATLSARGIKHQSFWVVNAIWVHAEVDSLRELAIRDDVAHIYANPPLSLQVPQPAAFPLSDETSESIEWNIQLVGAPELWAESVDGRDVVIGGQDTGYDWQHSALKEHYRGWDGQSANHDYNWHDAIHGGGGSCGADSPFPCDDYGHGTHTMGIMVGDDGAGNRIGVAPGARWIGCRNMDRGIGTPATYMECFQWFIAPTDSLGNADPSMAPDIINNSWSCPLSEGCDDPGILQDAVEAVRAAGILTVQSAGNGGPDCATIETPAAIYDATFTVGATNAADEIASYSSRGPVTVDGSGRLKPDVVAPGSGIRSSYVGGGYARLSGTSMAAPHVAGIAALILSASPELSGQVERLEQIIRISAARKLGNKDCFSFEGDRVPNAFYGYGRVDAVSAVRFSRGPRIWMPLFVNSVDGLFTDP